VYHVYKYTLNLLVGTITIGIISDQIYETFYCIIVYTVLQFTAKFAVNEFSYIYIIMSFDCYL